jgi:hypothetical protein
MSAGEYCKIRVKYDQVCAGSPGNTRPDRGLFAQIARMTDEAETTVRELLQQLRSPVDAAASTTTSSTGQG